MPLIKISGLTMVVLVATLALAACSSPPPPAPTPTLVPTPTALSIAVPAPTPIPANTPTPTSVSVPTPPSPPLPAPTPTSTSTPPPTATPLANVFDTYGFTIALDPSTSFANVDLAVAGFSEEKADTGQGVLNFAYKGAAILLFWTPRGEGTPQTMVATTYQLLQGSQPAVTFTPISGGDLIVSGEPGSFGGFVATETSGERAGGGLIGAWNCPGTDSTFSLTATGPDATALQVRFDRLIVGFKCA